MFQIMTNEDIRMNPGDTVSFEVVVHSTPCSYSDAIKFEGINAKVINKSASISSVNVSINNWYGSGRIPGDYTFIYTDGSWKLNNENVELLSYGIYLETNNILSAGDNFVVRYTKGDSSEWLPYGSYITFNIAYRSNTLEEYNYLSKKFYTTGRIETQYFDSSDKKVKTRIQQNKQNVSDDGNFLISLVREDTLGLSSSQFTYTISICYEDNGNLKYQQLNNKHILYIINDDFEGRNWCGGIQSIQTYRNEYSGYTTPTETIDSGYVSYANKQLLSQEQQKTARDNISAVNSAEVETLIDDVTLDELNQNQAVKVIFNGNTSGV